MKKIIGKILCCFGYHKLDKDDWQDRIDWDDTHLYRINFCKRCNKMITRYEE